jgi:hypothetical protein
LRDINGDGIPDYIAGDVTVGNTLDNSPFDRWTVYIGTGTGFAPPRLVNSPIGLELSLERNYCNDGGSGGREGIARTPTGLYDLDGDGQPEVVDMNFNTLTLDVYQLKPPVQQLEVGSVASVPAAGRLVKIDNGYGAITSIGYQSATEDTHSRHYVPYPEIVVTAEATTDTSGGMLLASTTHHAYRDAGLIFDPAFDAFTFRGYQRTVELRATDNEAPDGSVATITDTYGLAPFDPSMDATARFKRYLKVGRVSDVTVLAGRLGTDPWALAIGDLSHNIFRKSGRHYDWDVRLLPPGPRPADNEECSDMVFPYDFVKSQENQPTESLRTAYGTSRFFNTEGTPSCFVRGAGPQAFTTMTDEANERYPTCFRRFFVNHREFIDTQTADSLLPGSPQEGVGHRSAYSAVGQLLERKTYKSDASTGSRIDMEDAQFGYDRLGHLIRMERYQDPSQPTIAVATTWHFDSLGQLLELDEPQFRSYTNWGELVVTQWNDTTTTPSTDRRTINRYDALGRLVHREDQTNQVVNAATVNDFVYDQAINSTAPPVIATNVLGRLAKATSPTSSVSFSPSSPIRPAVLRFSQSK